MIDPANLYWDSCVFIRYLTRTPTAHLTDIDSFIKDAKNGKRKIFFSTIALTEIRPRFFKGSEFGFHTRPAEGHGFGLRTN